MLHGMWDLPGPGLEPMSPALAGGFLTTAPPGKSEKTVLALKEERQQTSRLIHSRMLLTHLQRGKFGKVLTETAWRLGEQLPSLPMKIIY